MEEETKRTAEEGYSVRSYADRVHRRIAYRQKKANTWSNGFIDGSDGASRFRGHSAIGFIPMYGHSELRTGDIVKLIDNSDLSERDKRAQVKAVARMGIFYASNSKYPQDAGTSMIQSLNDYLARTKNHRYAKKQARFIELYDAIRQHTADHGHRSTYENLDQLYQQHLFVKVPREIKEPKQDSKRDDYFTVDEDPTRKFRVKSIRQQDQEELRRKFDSGEWDFL